MKPHPRLRRTALVSGAVVSVLLIGVWIASARWNAGFHARWHSHTAIIAGQLLRNQWSLRKNELTPQQQQEKGWWFVQGHDEPFLWGFEYESTSPYFLTSPGSPDYGRGYQIAIPLWFPATLTILATASGWGLGMRARRRARVGACAKCGYDRAGLAPASPCPECGTNPGCGGGQP